MLKTILQWSRILRVDPDKTKEILNYISQEKIGDVMPCNVLEIKNNIKVMVKNRRMVRDRISKEKNRLRVNKWRSKKKSNAESNGKIMPPTSSSSSSSPSRCLTGGTDAGFLNVGGTYLDEIIKKCQKIHNLQNGSRGNKKINIEAWVNQSVNGGGHPKAIDYSIEQLIKKWDVVGQPWGYIEAIFQMKNGNFWEEHHVQESQKFKVDWESIDDRVKGLIEQINNGGDRK